MSSPGDFFERRARHSNIAATTLRAIWDRQGGFCALTGRALRQDASTELDHIIPRGGRGLNGASNRQWVCGEANQLKSNLSESKLIQLCIEVAAHEKSRSDNGAPG